MRCFWSNSAPLFYYIVRVISYHIYLLLQKESNVYSILDSISEKSTSSVRRMNTLSITHCDVVSLTWSAGYEVDYEISQDDLSLRWNILCILCILCIYIYCGYFHFRSTFWFTIVLTKIWTVWYIAIVNISSFIWSYISIIMKCSN